MPSILSVLFLKCEILLLLYKAGFFLEKLLGPVASVFFDGDPARAGDRLVAALR